MLVGGYAIWQRVVACRAMREPRIALCLIQASELGGLAAAAMRGDRAPVASMAAHAARPWAAEVVHDHYVAKPEFENENLIDVT
jgi:hypothetical protein